MWTRKELKEKGKLCFKRNYWKCVLVALIIAFVSGGTGGFSGATNSFSNIYKNNTQSQVETVVDDDKENDKENSFNIVIDTDNPDSDSIADQVEQNLDNMEPADKTAMVVSMVIVFAVVFIIIFALTFVFSAFVINPIVVGCDRFYFKNLDEPANFANIVHAFDHNYMNTVKTMFCRDIFTMLWTFLFIIPGIIKTYEYRMIPYILADNPEMDRKEVFALSKELMTGNKWKAFVLDLSFLGWEILSIFTCGILSIFYVNPYIFSTNAALYETLRYGNAAE